MYQIIRKVHNGNEETEWVLSNENNNLLYFETHCMAINHMKDLFELYHLTNGQMLILMESQNVHIKSIFHSFCVELDLGKANWSEIVHVSSEFYDKLSQEL
jgi:hypothetical protein